MWEYKVMNRLPRKIEYSQLYIIQNTRSQRKSFINAVSSSPIGKTDGYDIYMETHYYIIGTIYLINRLGGWLQFEYSNFRLSNTNTVHLS